MSCSDNELENIWLAELLNGFAVGDSKAREQLLRALYQELHAIACGHMAHERGDHSLQPTALVNEAFLRLMGTGNRNWESKAKLLSYAAKVMQSILVDHARRRRAQKRGGHWIQVDLASAFDAASDPQLDLDVFDEAMAALEALSPRQAQVLRLRYICGLTVEESALALDISERTVKSESRFGIAWIRKYLSDHPRLN